MIEIDVPGRGLLQFHHLVLDLNGTLATDGLVPPPVVDRVRALCASLQVHVVTADTFGTAGTLEGLGARIVRLPPGDQVGAKATFVRALGREQTMAIGNGMNDEALLREAALGILVVGREGAAVRSLLAADLLVTSIEDGLDLLASPKRLIASLRTA
ncbi:MAG TPA: ATPase P [Candidatus Methylomirabilis sp.]|nr:ATPase P [Candidatus Methylomirabilis sp.]